MERASEDMIMEILFRLPVKSLASFKCVSKKWNQFISCDPYFRKNYEQVGGSTHMMGVFHQQSELGEIQFPQFAHTSDQGKMLKKLKGPFDESLSYLDGRPQQLVDSSNGFLLVCSYSDDTLTPSNYNICNPITKKYVSLPTPKRVEVMATSFVCNESLNHYKVVRMILPEDYHNLYTTLAIDVFDNQMLGVPRWKEFDLTCSHPIRLNSDAQGIISENSGLVYWPVYTKKWTPNYSCDSIVVFDQKRSSQLEIVPLPGTKEKHGPGEFGQTNGMIVYTRYNDHDINMWVLDEDAKEWVLKYNVENSTENLQFSYIESFHPLHPHLILIRLRNEKVVWYNLESKITEGSHTVEDHPSGTFVFLPYICTCWPPSFFLFR